MKSPEGQNGAGLVQVKRAISVAGKEANGSPTHNLLVCSDLHLGDSLAPGHHALRTLAKLNRSLAKFLLHYATERVDGRPWRLVINGDMIDFLHAGLSGSGDVAHSEQAAIDWLEKVMSRERRVFRALGSFVAAGHELVIIKGNHDVQFHWDGVRARFLDILFARWAKSEGRRGEAPSPAVVAAHQARVSFRDWFYYEQDLVYIEHGNQYDEFCSYEHVMQPIDPEHQSLEDPVSHRLYREFARIISTVLDVHHIDRWRLFDYVRWLVGLGPRVIAQLAYTYFSSIAWMMDTKRQLVGVGRARAAHLTRRSQLVRYGISEEILHKLDELRQRPAGLSVFKGLRMLYMDRVFLAGANLLFAFACLFFPVDWWTRVGLVTAFGLFSTVANQALERRRQVEAHPKLRRAAVRVAELMAVPFVVFGHSHVPVAEQAAESTRYFNTGSWTKGGLTHLCIVLDPSGPVAELRRFCLDSHLPMSIDSTRVD